MVVELRRYLVDGHQQWTCAAAPLRDPVGGGLLGVVDPAAVATRAVLDLAVARAPQGLTAAELADALFADPARTVTVRAEVSRLRRAVGPLLATRPYRLADGVTVEAVLPPPGRVLLAGSVAPVVLGGRAAGPPPG